MNQAIRAFEGGLTNTRATQHFRLEHVYLAELCRQCNLSRDDQQFVDESSKYWACAIIAARKRDLTVAEKVLNNARRFADERDAVTASCKSLCASFQAAAEAYLHYAKENYDAARDLLSEAIDRDTELVRQHGWHLIDLHRVQLVHNMVRIEIRCKNYGPSLQLLGQLLRYLQGEPQELPGQDWDRGYLRQVPAQFTTAMFNQVVAESAAVLVLVPHFDASRFLAGGRMRVSGGEACIDKRSAGYRWLEIKETYFSDAPKFLERCKNFLKTERAESPTLWFATALDLVAICNKIDSARAKAIALDLSIEPMPAVLEAALVELTTSTRVSFGEAEA